MPYFGTSMHRKDVEAAIAAFEHEIEATDLGDAWPERIGELVVRHRVGGIVHGRMEWGPRALGNRSIIADPRDASIKALLNDSIKKRSSFQPFCPSIMIEEQERLFADSYQNRHMTCAFRMREEYWDALPGAIHADGTARVQFVSMEDNANYYRILRKVKEITGFGVLLNTSFNKHGRTIVETPADAITDFLDTNMPFLCIEGILITRKDSVPQT
jgi:carbamoyltransferase